MITGTYFSQSSVNWLTNGKIVYLARKAFGGQIDLDPCPSTVRSNWFAKKNWFLGGPVDSLKVGWSIDNKPTKIFVNPPFGSSYVLGTQCIGQDEHKKLPESQADLWKQQTIYMWAEKCVKEAKEGNEIIWISKASTETEALQKVLEGSSGVCFPKGRVSYLDPITRQDKKQPTFGSVLLYLGNNPSPFIQTFSEIGITRKLT